MNGSDVVDDKILSTDVPAVSPITLLIPPSTSSVLVQLSSEGFKFILPIRTITS